MDFPGISRRGAFFVILNHPCILHIYDMKQHKNYKGIILDYCSGGDLLDRLNRTANKRFTEKLTKFYLFQICCGVAYLHERNIAHCDLKPENTLLHTTEEYTLVKLADFGSAKQMANSPILTCATEIYAAPEIHRNDKECTVKVDVWSIGVILYYCISGSPTRPFKNSFDVKKSFKKHKEIWQHSSIDLIVVVCEFLTKKPSDRPTISKLIEKSNWLSLTDPTIRSALKTMTHGKQ